MVDNASRDNSVIVAKALGAKVIETGKNSGFAKANNIGLYHATGEYVAFVNPDVTVDFESFETIAFCIDRLGALVGPQLVNLDGTLQPNGRGFPRLMRKVMNRVVPNGVHPKYRITANRGDTRVVPWLTGAAITGRRESFRKLKGWEESFFLYHEDTDLCLRAWAAEIPVVLLGDVRWVHGWARETSKFRFLPWKRELDSLFRFYRKYPRLIFSDKSWKDRIDRVNDLNGIATSDGKIIG